MNESPIVWHPTAEYTENSAVNLFMRQHNIDSYGDLLTRSENLEWFWDAFIQFAGIEFYKPYQHIVDLTHGLPFPKWFVGSHINIAHNALDKWALNPATSTTTALIWESETGDVQHYTYSNIFQQANKVANVLRELGIQRGDRVAIYMPLIPETVIAVFGIYKIGAVVVPLFSGFGYEAIVIS